MESRTNSHITRRLIDVTARYVEFIRKYDVTTPITKSLVHIICHYTRFFLKPPWDIPAPQKDPTIEF